MLLPAVILQAFCDMMCPLLMSACAALHGQQVLPESRLRGPTGNLGHSQGPQPLLTSLMMRQTTLVIIGVRTGSSTWDSMTACDVTVMRGRQETVLIHNSKRNVGIKGPVEELAAAGKIQVDMMVWQLLAPGPSWIAVPCGLAPLRGIRA